VDPLLTLRLVVWCGAGVGGGEKNGAPVFVPGPDLCSQLLARCEVWLLTTVFVIVIKAATADSGAREWGEDMRVADHQEL